MFLEKSFQQSSLEHILSSLCLGTGVFFEKVFPIAAPLSTPFLYSLQNTHGRHKHISLFASPRGSGRELHLVSSFDASPVIAVAVVKRDHTHVGVGKVALHAAIEEDMKNLKAPHSSCLS